MTKIVNSEIRSPEHAPDLQWMKWTRQNLPNAKNFWVSDIDSIFRTREGCILLIELKRKNSQMTPNQRVTYGFLSAVLKACEGLTLENQLIGRPLEIKKFLGVYTLIFENTWFDDGKVYIEEDGGSRRPISEVEVKKLFSLESYCTDCFPSKECACDNQFVNSNQCI